MSRSSLTATVGSALACPRCGSSLGSGRQPPGEGSATATVPDTSAAAPEKPAGTEKKLTAEEVEFIKKAGAGNEADPV